MSCRLQKHVLSFKILILVIAFLGCACVQSDQTNLNPSPPKFVEITVSAAASLQNAFREIAAICEKQNKVKINFNFASSGVLQKQIEQDAPVDVFASAGEMQMKSLAEKNLILPETRRDFARNELALVAPRKEAVLNLSFARALENDESRIAVGNPQTVPAGQYAAQILRNLDLLEKLRPRLVYGEDVRQVLDYVARGEVGYGIVYASDVKIADNKVATIALAPENSHEPIFYSVAIVKNSQNQAAAQEFIETLLSQEAQRILQQNGFQPIKKMNFGAL